MLGGSRNADDAARVEQLRALARALDVDVSLQSLLTRRYPLIASAGKSPVRGERRVL